MKNLKKVVIISALGFGLVSSSLIALDEAKTVSGEKEIQEYKAEKSEFKNSCDDSEKNMKPKKGNCGCDEKPEPKNNCGEKPERPMHKSNCGCDEKPEPKNNCGEKPERPMHKSNCGCDEKPEPKNNCGGKSKFNGDEEKRFLPPQELEGSQMGRRPNPILDIVSELDLSKEQRNAVYEIMESNKDFRSAMQETKKVRPVLSDYVTDKSFDKEKFTQDMIEFETAKVQGRTAHMVETFEKIFNILTPEQRTQGLELMKKFEQEKIGKFKERRF